MKCGRLWVAIQKSPRRHKGHEEINQKTDSLPEILFEIFLAPTLIVGGAILGDVRGETS